MTMTDVCDISDLTADGVTIRFRQQRHIDALQALAQRARYVLTERGDYGVPGMGDRITRLESAVSGLSVVSASRWTTAELHSACGALNGLLRVTTMIPGIFITFQIEDLGALKDAAEALDKALRLMAAMRLRQAGGAA